MYGHLRRIGSAVFTTLALIGALVIIIGMAFARSKSDDC